MGIFSNSTPFDADVEKITDEKNTSEDWGIILDLCDRVGSTTNGPKDCLKSIMKRLNHQDPHVVLQAVTLLDACVNNCGRNFKLEIASADFEKEFKRLVIKSHPKISSTLLEMLKKWANGEFKNDPQLALIPGLFNSLRADGAAYGAANGATPKSKTSAASKNPDAVSNQQEEDDIAKAIQLSLAEAKSPTTQSSRSNTQLYPSTTGDIGSATSVPVKEQKKGRALYDFEAAEDNELTFKAGEIVIITDDSDGNWWKGSNHRGEGLFPANFVITDLDAAPEEEPKRAEEKRRRSVQFNEEVEVKTLPQQEVGPVEISEEKIDNVILMLEEADPTNFDTDPPDLGLQEEQVNAMGPLIDTELEAIDRRHAQLTRISTELVDALNLYHQLMHEIPVQSAPMGGYMMPGAAPPMSQHPGAYNPAMYGIPMPAAPMPGSPISQGQGYPAAPVAGAPLGHPEMMNGAPAPNAYPVYAAPPQQMTPTTLPMQQDQPHQPISQLDQNSQSIGPAVNNQPYYTNAAAPPQLPVTTSESQNPSQQQPHFGSMAPQQPGPEGYVLNGAPQPPMDAVPMSYPQSQVPPMN